MKPINEAAVTFLSRSANEGFARSAVAASGDGARSSNCSSSAAWPSST